MNHWLMKTEPSTFGIDDLAKKPKKTAMWDGVRNYQARNMLRDDFRKGDLAFLYHSSSDEIGVAGIVQVVRAAYADPSAFDRKSEYYDAGSDRENPRWYVVDVQLKRRLKRVITLDELRAHADEELDGLLLLRRGNRLSITPVSDAHWDFILSLE
ncbi:MAG TPA: EVE domain-containing protein [Steroidobacteraceae bacterium]|nr:EVE domain-containing protein [Steroidobacteraceae bacterium]